MLPVEIWKRNKKWTFKHNSKETLKEVVIDPDYVFPDVNSKNNRWTSRTALENKVDLSAFLGEFSSDALPIVVNVTEKNSDLVAIVEGQPPIPLTDEGGGKFVFEEADLEIQYNSKKSGFEMRIGGQAFEFIKN